MCMVITDEPEGCKADEREAGTGRIYFNGEYCDDRASCPHQSPEDCDLGGAMVTLRTCDGEQVLAEMSGPLYGTVYRVEGGKIAGKVNTPAGNLYSLIVLCDKDIALTKGDVLHATPVTTRFRKLNGKWNAEPNAPNVSVKVEGSDVVVTFRKDPRFSSDDTGTLRFRSCQRYRLGSPSYEDWRRGKCRFSKVVPKWGEFYEVYDDLLLDACPDDWVEVGSGTGRLRHFLFYFRDNTFECDAEDWGWDWD